MSKLTVVILAVLISLMAYIAYWNSLTPEKALDTRLKAMAEMEKNAGPEHADTFGAAFNRAMLYTLHGQHDKAIPLFEKAVEIRKKQHVSSRPELDTSLLSLAQAYDLAGQPGKADPIYDELLMRPQAPAGKTKQELAALHKAVEKMSPSEQQRFLDMAASLPMRLSQKIEAAVLTLKAHGRHSDAERLRTRIEWVQTKEKEL